MKRYLLNLLLVFIPLTALARPQTRLAEGENCDVEPSVEVPVEITPTVIPTVIPTVTPTIEETVTSPEPPSTSCEFYKVDLKSVGHVKSATGLFDAIMSDAQVMSYDEMVKQDDASAKLGCLNELVNNAKEKCTKDFYEFNGEGFSKRTKLFDRKTGKAIGLDFRYDDCIATYLTKDYMLLDSKLHDSIGIGVCNTNNQYMTYSYTASRIVNGKNGKDINLCADGYYYMDSNCRGVNHDLVESDAVCGTTHLSYAPSSSPISLIWESGFNPNTDIRFTRFSLDRIKPWTTWKASDKAPLLVYDPSETNYVKDATQLFGNWTFGGKRLAALASDNVSLQWSDGYEALGSLDSDHNGKVDGEELNSIALWFDTNRNGISENGEVKRAKELGITALFYKGALRDSISNDLRLEIGYERVVAGYKHAGASIDWYGVSAPSKAALADYYGFIKNTDAAPETTEMKSTALNSAHGKFSGVWKWFIESDSSAPNGYLIFNEDEDSNSVTGYSFVEREFSKSPKNFLKSMINFFKLKGTTQVRNDVGILIFELTDKNRKTKSVVTLTEDGNELHGTSYVTVARGAEIANYTWVAKKM